MKIDGRKIADDIILRLKKRAKPQKILAAIIVGNDPRSISFIKQKEQTAKELGVDFRTYNLSEKLGNDGLRHEVGRISKQKSIGAVIAQLPLPKEVNGQYVLNAIPKEKDVDVLGERAIGAFYVGRNLVFPPAVGAVKEILEQRKIKLSETAIAVVGLGGLVGKPISTWLTRKCKELYLLASKSDLNILSRADVVISGVGKAGIIKPDMLKNGAGVIDFGYHYSDDGKISGDFDTENAEGKVSFYTGTPGGTGPILVAKLLENFYTLCETQQ